MIPAELRALKGWLLWELLPSGQPGGKPRKVPCYVDGSHRSGKQGSPRDRERLVTYDEAVRALDADTLTAGRFEGLGFALLADWGVVGLDFDNCVDAAGHVTPEVAAVIKGTYAEFSPSGTGVHAFLHGKLADRKSSAAEYGWGFETFCEKGFLTVTGRETPDCELCGFDALDHLNGAVTELFEQRFGSAAQGISFGDGAAPAPDAEGLGDDQLRDLLKWHDADASYDEKSLKQGSWLRVGMALHHETGGAQRGLELWDAWSATGSKYAGGGRALIESKWAGFGSGTALVTAQWLRMVADSRSNGLTLDASWAEVIPDDRPPVRADDDVTLASGMGLVTKIGRVLPAVKRRGIPEANYLTTDQANAQRLKDSFGSLVFVAAGKWHVWDGQRWVADESDVYRYACRLSDLIRGEAKSWRAKGGEAEARGDAAEAKKLKAVADALDKWALRSEMKGTIEAAIGLARKMLTIDSAALDRDPWALNCENGIVDLRTGRVRPHDPAEYITKLVSVVYDPKAECPLWESVLARITLEHDLPASRRVIARFLGRWFGYCLTGKTTEQCFVVHWGAEGSNGKSTVLGLMADTLGDYASTAAPGLLTASKGDRHPTEIAALFGRRMTTAHETGENVVLREDFIKQATGGDKLTARYMREDFFEFEPTHKLQLLTNHKPTIKGQDGGIWRRVQLVPYLASFGDPEQVESGARMFLRDVDMPEKLREELPGILAWRVRGAVEWAQVGLQAPPSVKAASDAYRTEQDRIGQFVGECCELGEGMEELLSGIGGMSSTDGLYPAYVRWCKEGGVFPVSKVRFVGDVPRVVPLAKIETRNLPIGNGKRQKGLVVHGIRLSVED